jgi:hypothetical protein
MKIIQFTQGIDNETFQPMGLFTIEMPLGPMRDSMTTMSDEQLERFIGRQFLEAFHAFKKENEQATDVDEKVSEQDVQENGAEVESSTVQEES